MAYATPGDYQTFTGAAGPADIAVRLERASDAVDELLLPAVYDTDASGLPTDPAVVVAVKLAACAVAQHRIDQALTATGASPAFDSVKIGSVSLGRRGAASGSGASADKYGPDAYGYLQRAGLLPGNIRTY